MTVNSKNTVFLTDLTFRNEFPHLLCCVWVLSVADTPFCLYWPVHVIVSYYIFPHIIFDNGSNFVTDKYSLINNVPFQNTSIKLNENLIRLLEMVILIYIKLHVLNLHTYYKLNGVLQEYFVRQLAALLSQNISHDRRQHSTCHYSNLSWVNVHLFQFSVLQFILGFYSSYSKHVMKIFSFSSQLSV